MNVTANLLKELSSILTSFFLIMSCTFTLHRVGGDWEAPYRRYFCVTMLLCTGLPGFIFTFAANSWPCLLKNGLGTFSCIPLSPLLNGVLFFWVGARECFWRAWEVHSVEGFMPNFTGSVSSLLDASALLLSFKVIFSPFWNFTMVLTWSVFPVGLDDATHVQVRDPSFCKGYYDFPLWHRCWYTVWASSQFTEADGSCESLRA